MTSTPDGALDETALDPGPETGDLTASEPSGGPTPPEDGPPVHAQAPLPVVPVLPPAAAPPVIEPTAVEEWNPLATVETTRIPVPSSTPPGPEAKPRAWLIVKPWSGRERLTYEDSLLSRFLLPGDAEDGVEPEDVPDKVKLATMKLVGAALTLQGSEGFPARADGSPMFSGGDKRRVEAELLALSEDAYSEIRDLCLRYQPLPRAELNAGPSDAADNDGSGDSEGGDPFPTPSTQATAAPPPDVTG